MRTQGEPQAGGRRCQHQPRPPATNTRRTSRRAARPVHSRFWLPMATPVTAVAGVAGAGPGRRAGGPLHGGTADEGARAAQRPPRSNAAHRPFGPGGTAASGPGRPQRQPEQAGRVVGGRFQLTCRPGPGFHLRGVRHRRVPPAEFSHALPGTQLDRSFTFGRWVHDRRPILTAGS